MQEQITKVLDCSSFRTRRLATFLAGGSLKPLKSQYRDGIMLCRRGSESLEILLIVIIQALYL